MEVVSPNDTHSEVVEKALAWLESGSRLVLVADPGNNTLTVYRSPHDVSVLRQGETADGGDVVPGWKLSVGQLFE